METEDCPDQNQDFQHTYDDEHDSDVEARLYAEVYYSNTIIGEENITNNSTSQNQCPNSSNNSNEINSNNHDLLQNQNTTQQNSNGNITCDSNVVVSNDSTNSTLTNASNATKQSNTQNTNTLSKKSVSTPKINNKSNSKKRKSNDCLDDASKSSKRRKNENQNTFRESQAKQCNELSSVSKSNQKKNNTVECIGSALINPYNKNALANGQNSMQRLSPELINLSFPRRTTLNKENRISRSKRKSGCNITPNVDTIQQPLNIKPVENNFDKEFSTKSAVIDISSDSNESCDNDSKYNTIVATDKKLKERESGLKNKGTHDGSDSEESIFEVPVPPKPAPPVIEVNDSDNECRNQNESDDDSFLNDIFISQDPVAQSNHEISLDSTQATCEIISDSDDSNSLILNCTGVQRGVSSLDEIKKMNQQTPSQRNPSTSNSNNVQLENSQNESESSNPVVIEKSPTNLQKSKQKSKSSRKNIPEADYFFQPMNEKMKSFYNDSWGGENFDMVKIKSNMSTDPNKWAILNKDLVLTGPRKRRYFGMTCARCHKDGHRQNDCPEPNKGPTCHMCGTNGHIATYCPHTKCLTCGRKQAMYRTTCGYCEKLFCTRCRSRGHKDDSCPDLWRRYHHTTNSHAPKIPLNVNNIMKSRHELFCCNCTRQGHDSMACRKLRWSQHFANPSFVTHYSGPSYSAITNFSATPIVNDLQENPYNVYSKYDYSKASYDYSSNCDNSFSNTMVSNSVLTSFPRSDRRNESSAQNAINHTISVSDSDKKIIFHISGKKKTFNEGTKTMRSVTLKLNVPDKSNPDAVEKWKKLSGFLKELVRDLSAEFSLERKDKHLLMYIKCSRPCIEYLSSIIKQYSCRSDLERSQMLLNCERNVKAVVEHLSRKFAEMKNLNEDISTLYEETSRLRKELLNKEGQTQNEIHDKSKLNELFLSQKKLLMLLYREGFGDESLGKLRKLFLRMQKLTEQSPDKHKSKKSYRYASMPLMSIKMLITYLYNYNNIFVPDYGERLESYIQKYKDNLNKRNKLLNCSLLFPRPTDEKQKDSNEMPITITISNEKALSEDLSKALPSTLNEQSVLENIVTEAPLDTVTVNNKVNSLNLESSNQTSVSPKKKTKKQLNGLYLQAIKARSQDRKENFMQIFRNFLKNTRNCLATASKLNSPRLRGDIIHLERELEDEIYLNVLTVSKFKKKVRAEVSRLQGAPNATKIKKKRKLTSNRDNIYKEFCASL